MITGLRGMGVTTSQSSSSVSMKNWQKERGQRG
uniref:Uncharacterized protein n=1 Tax=Anguilla anguilla TaxID=7936 RepID=A0A0E9Q544_ANGAN